MVRRLWLFVLVLLAPAAEAQAPGPDTCVSGFVWREAFPQDHVCVDPTVRAQAASDNQLAPQRRARGGEFGPDTCRAGFVWRDTRPDDHVCVTPQTREQAASDNRAAASRIVRPQVAPGAAVRPGPGTRTDRRGNVARTVTPRSGLQLPPRSVLQPPPPRPASGSASKRGFDNDGNPYIEDTLPDGSKRREGRSGVTLIHPDGSSEFYPYMFVAANAQPPTPPDLPADPARGLNWVNFHNGQLLDLISMLVNYDAAELQKFHREEDKQAGPDPFRQIRYRIDVLEVLAKP